MKKLLIVLAFVAGFVGFIFFLASTEKEETQIVVGAKPAGIELKNAEYKWDEWKGNYEVFATLNNGSSQEFKNIQVNAIFKDADGNKIGEALAGPGREFKPGDSERVRVNFLFPTEEDLPATVELTVTN